MQTPINSERFEQPSLPAAKTPSTLVRSPGEDCALMSALSFSWARAYRELIISGELRGRYGRGRIG